MANLPTEAKLVPVFWSRDAPGGSVNAYGLKVSADNALYFQSELLHSRSFYCNEDIQPLANGQVYFFSVLVALRRQKPFIYNRSESDFSSLSVLPPSNVLNLERGHLYIGHHVNKAGLVFASKQQMMSVIEDTAFLKTTVSPRTVIPNVILERDVIFISFRDLVSESFADPTYNPFIKVARNQIILYGRPNIQPNTIPPMARPQQAQSQFQQRQKVPHRPYQQQALSPGQFIELNPNASAGNPVPAGRSNGCMNSMAALPSLHSQQESQQLASQSRQLTQPSFVLPPPIMKPLKVEQTVVSQPQPQQRTSAAVDLLTTFRNSSTAGLKIFTHDTNTPKSTVVIPDQAALPSAPPNTIVTHPTVAEAKLQQDSSTNSSRFVEAEVSTMITIPAQAESKHEASTALSQSTASIATVPTTVAALREALGLSDPSNAADAKSTTVRRRIESKKHNGSPSPVAGNQADPYTAWNAYYANQQANANISAIVKAKSTNEQQESKSEAETTVVVPVKVEPNSERKRIRSSKAPIKEAKALLLYFHKDKEQRENDPEYHKLRKSFIRTKLKNIGWEIDAPFWESKTKWWCCEMVFVPPYAPKDEEELVFGLDYFFELEHLLRWLIATDMLALTERIGHYNTSAFREFCSRFPNYDDSHWNLQLRIKDLVIHEGENAFKKCYFQEMLVKDGWGAFEVGAARRLYYIPPEQVEKGVSMKNYLEHDAGVGYLDRSETILYLKRAYGLISADSASVLPAKAAAASSSSSVASSSSAAIITPSAKWSKDVMEINPRSTSSYQSSGSANMVGKKRGLFSDKKQDSGGNSVKKAKRESVDEVIDLVDEDANGSTAMDIVDDIQQVEDEPAYFVAEQIMEEVTMDLPADHEAGKQRATMQPTLLPADKPSKQSTPSGKKA